MFIIFVVVTGIQTFVIINIYIRQSNTTLKDVNI
jgi:hypothetical protein